MVAVEMWLAKRSRAANFGKKKKGQKMIEQVVSESNSASF